jgi:hypothetical protein
MITLITGVPGAGKTTVAASLTDERNILHTDTLIPLGWEAQSDQALIEILHPAVSVIEGCSIVRALARWAKQRTVETIDPPWRVIWMPEPYDPERRPDRMTKTVLSTWKFCIHALEASNVPIERIIHGETVVPPYTSNPNSLRPRQASF